MGGGGGWREWVRAGTRPTGRVPEIRRISYFCAGTMRATGITVRRRQGAERGVAESGGGSGLGQGWGADRVRECACDGPWGVCAGESTGCASVRVGG